jgi:hypothetical protein
MKSSSDLPLLPPHAEGAGRGLNRRQMVQWLVGGAGAGAMWPAIAAGHPVREHLMNDGRMAAAEAQAGAAAWQPLLLDAHQSETLEALAERIIPGSRQARANRTIDLLLSVDSIEVKRQFVESLSVFEAEALARYKTPFKDLSEAQQNEILSAASGPAQDHQAAIPMRRFAAPHDNGDRPMTLQDHFENIKQWVKGAYYSSEVGMKDLGWDGQVMWPAYPGCQHPEGHV